MWDHLRMATMRNDLLLNRIAGSPLVSPRIRWRLYKLLGVEVGPSRIYSGLFLGGRNITIGSGVFINHGCFIDDSAHVAIGDNVHFAMNVTVVTSSHEIGDRAQRAGAATAEPVTIEKGSWIGAGVVIQPGVTIASGCVIASRAVVTKDTLPDGIYAGVPATRIRDL